MNPRKILRSLEDLSKLLPESSRPPPSPAVVAPVAGHDGGGRSVQVRIERKGRKGKTVTIVAGLQHNPDTMEEIARTLKQHCGAGGTVKEGLIEIQGDNRERVAERLRAMHYLVK